MGIGCIGAPIHFEAKEDVSPVQLPVHRVPVAKRIKERAALQQYVDAGIIAKVHKPTPYCSI